MELHLLIQGEAAVGPSPHHRSAESGHMKFERRGIENQNRYDL
jgi:hypothetical protein